MLLGGYKIESFPTKPSLVSELRIPALDTSLLTLKLKVFRSDCQGRFPLLNQRGLADPRAAESRALFAPLLRQYSPALHESKFYPNVRTASLYTYSSGPYIPASASPFVASGSHLQFFLDPTCPRTKSSADIALEVTVDIWATLGSLALRYRMAGVAFPFSLVMLVVARQLRVYNKGSESAIRFTEIRADDFLDPYLAFGPALSLCTKDSLIPLFGIVTLASLVQAISLGTHLASSESLYLSEPGHAAHASPPSSVISDLLLGNRSPAFVFLAVFLIFVAVGLVFLEYAILQGLISGAAALAALIQQRGSASLKAVLSYVSSHESMSAADLPCSITETRETLVAPRIVSMSVLVLLVLFFAPYQFAFIVTFLVHFFTTVKSLIHAQDTTAPSTPAAGKHRWDRYHYHFSLLLVMLCLLPINALILVVWVRNLAVGWIAPFSSDHNVLSVMGFLLNVEALHSGKMLNRSGTGFVLHAPCPLRLLVLTSDVAESAQR